MGFKKRSRLAAFVGITLMVAATVCRAQINTGSTGSDGALDFSTMTNLGYSTNIVIDMHDHPNGIYQYSYVSIPPNVTLSFIPNASNTPVIWLVQNNVAISGTINISALGAIDSRGTAGGPGGYRGGNGSNGGPATAGQGPGGGGPSASGNFNYGNSFLLPLLGGSGGGGGPCAAGGGGGGGAILIAASTIVRIDGSIRADGGAGCSIPFCGGGGGGSGGAIRIVASQITGAGYLTAYGGGPGRIRFDTYDNEFNGSINDQFTSGFQPIIIPSAGQLPQLTVTSVGGIPVSPSPTGRLATPDALISAQQNNPIPIVVSCANLPLNSLVTVSVTPMTGSAVSATGSNNSGTLASSTATISINIPRGGGLIYATATISK